MRYLSLLILLCLLAALLAVTGCGKKLTKDNTPPPAKLYSTGPCAVCGKQSSTLIEFGVPHGPKVKVCSQACGQKIIADPKTYGGSNTSGTSGSTASPAPATPATVAAPVAGTPPPGAPPARVPLTKAPPQPANLAPPPSTP
jgi:hypothetical protein